MKKVKLINQQRHICQMIAAPTQLASMTTVSQMTISGAGQWKSGLCDCCSLSICCQACCCPCCVFGDIAATMSPSDGPCCAGNKCGACCLYYVLISLAGGPSAGGTWYFPLHAIVQAPMRTAIRKKYNIPGDACEDVAVVIFLPCCALSQVLLFL
jgi:Cys-rich protein (TIGR01571 family)